MINIRARGEREDSSDLTSLIDVVFILLIFFILAASFAVHSIVLTSLRQKHRKPWLAMWLKFA